MEMSCLLGVREVEILIGSGRLAVDEVFDEVIDCGVVDEAFDCVDDVVDEMFDCVDDVDCGDDVIDEMFDCDVVDEAFDVDVFCVMP